MKTTQYIKQERAIAAADRGGIRERWLWGLRLLRDPEAMASEKSLKHGVTDELVAVATARGYKLSAREIQRRIQCARTYQTEDEIRQALADFETWDDLHRAGFPTYPAPADEPPADHRTETEREHAKAHALLDLIGEQGALFPASMFEPVETPLKDLAAYAEEMCELTGRFVQRDEERRAYLDQLIAAADGDLSMTWQEAQQRLSADTDDDRDDDAERAA